MYQNSGDVSVSLLQLPHLLLHDKRLLCFFWISSPKSNKPLIKKQSHTVWDPVKAVNLSSLLNVLLIKCIYWMRSGLICEIRCNQLKQHLITTSSTTGIWLYFLNHCCVPCAQPAIYYVENVPFGVWFKAAEGLVFMVPKGLTFSHNYSVIRPLRAFRRWGIDSPVAQCTTAQPQYSSRRVTQQR